MTKDIRPTVDDIVTYDCVASYAPHYPYRSRELFDADDKACQGLRKGAPVQIIREHGDSMWTPATKLRWESIPGNDMGMMRYVVTLPDGAEHIVDISRIRPAR